MVRRNMKRWTLATMVALMAWSTTAGANQLTGNVETDFPDSKDEKGKGISIIRNSTDPYHLGQAKWMTERGWVNGWSVKDIRLAYDAKADVLYVGVNTFGIAGDVDGNGDPGKADPLLTQSGGIDPANFGADKSITVGFAPVNPGKPGTKPDAPLFVAGIPADKTQAGTGLNGFKVAAFNGTTNGIEFGFGSTMPFHTGTLFYNPSAEHPDFEFSIPNISKIPGVNLKEGLWVNAYAGSFTGVVAGKDYVDWQKTAALATQTVPEPTTVLAWSMILGGSALYARRRRPARS